MGQPYDPLVGEIEQNQSVLDNSPDYSEIWGRLYQSESDPEKMSQFKQHSYESDFQPMRQAIDDIYPAFEGDLGDWMSGDQFKELLYRTSRHESFNPYAPGTPHVEQQGGGPAKSWWQVEPSTARDIVTAYNEQILPENYIGPPQMLPNVSKQYWGPRAEEATKFSAEDLYNMSDDDLGQLLKDNPKVGAAMAASKYIKAHRASQFK